MPILLRVPWGAKRLLDPSKLSPTLAENSWKMIARASTEGIASQVWSVGDEIDIVLSGDYTGSITMQIAGFDHDDLVSGGKAGITFLSKQLVSSEKMDPSSGKRWDNSALRSNTMPKIKASLPDALQRYIRPVFKVSSLGHTYDGMSTTEDEIFIPSLAEVLSGISGTINYRYASKFNNTNAGKDGARYEVFGTLSDIVKQIRFGSTSSWWTRSICETTYLATIARGAESYDVGDLRSDSQLGICFGFCI